ncbi:hypothetical protein LSH36_496g00005 [Paralvinella palmiformis]|uniref:Sulfotransferase n=1 Tax=Paralvinella palmiformis TaxID=53620 RepID=A0AAD9MWX7_9ANNE|nr:hypothetical protein LSH36_496g00005 [Paralvinella palmiformis]
MPDWLRVFPRDQIHVIRSEDYFVNRKPVLDDVVEFLGLDPYTRDLIPILTDPVNKIIRNNKHHVAMFNKTRRLLEGFFQPFNDDLDRMLGQQFWVYGL